MKNISSFWFAALLLLGAFAAQAQTIRRVNNTGISGTNIYADLPAAYTAAAVGDIIQVEPSGTPYNGIILDKNVTIVGPGYFLDPATQNAGLQANPLTATVNSIELRSGGAAAYVAGLTVSNFYIEASNVTVQRLLIGTLYLNGTNNFGPYLPLSGVNIKQNYIFGTSAPANTGNDNMLFANNVFANSISLPANYNGGLFNNVFLSSVAFSNFFVTNNYFANLTTYGNGNTMSNNISGSASFPTTNGNQAGVPQNAVFVLAPGSTAFDGWYQLKAGTNPARGTGVGGTDVGIFSTYSTNAPYKLGGLPNIPAIYQQSQTITGNTLTGTLSTRSNN